MIYIQTQVKSRAAQEEFLKAVPAPGTFRDFWERIRGDENTKSENVGQDHRSQGSLGQNKIEYVHMGRKAASILCSRGRDL